MRRRWSWFKRKINGAAPDFLSRHFTWLSSTLLGILVVAILVLVLLYVPSVTANQLLANAIKLVMGIATAITVIAGTITIQGWLKRSRFSSRESPEERREDGLSTPARAFVRTDAEILEKALDLLEDWFSVSEGGDISLHPPEAISGQDRQGMLYVVAITVAHQAGEAESPWVTWQELKDEVGFTTASANVFVSKMGNFIERNYDPDDFERMRDMDPEEVAVKLNISEAHEAARYIAEERRAPN